MDVQIPDDIAAFLESGLSIVVGCRDANLRPDGAAAWAAWVHPDRTHLTLYMHEQGAARLLRHLAHHPQIAMVFDLPTSHRACQVKGVMVSSRAATEEERPLVMRQMEALSTDVEAIGIPRVLFAGLQTWPCTAVEVRMTALFEQTPGPGTGEPLQ